VGEEAERKHSLIHAMPKAGCAMQWKDMEGDERVRTCPLCREQVYNPEFFDAAQLQNLAEDAASARKKKNEQVPQLYRRADGKIMVAKGTCGRVRDAHMQTALIVLPILASLPLWPGSNDSWAHAIPMAMICHDIVRNYLESRVNMMRATSIGAAIGIVLAGILMLLPLDIVRVVYWVFVPLMILTNAWFVWKHDIAKQLTDKRKDDLTTD
jgi:hypothetical protein